MANNFKLYSFILNPLSAFSTPFKGDTLFGMFVWQLANNNGLLNTTFDDFIKSYKEDDPYAIFSSASLFKDNIFFFKRPSCTFSNFKNQNVIDNFDTISKRKEDKKKNYFKVAKEDIVNDYCINIIKDNFLEINVDKENTIHNKINRITSTTGAEGFAPYSSLKVYIKRGYKFAIFVVFDENKLSLDNLKNALANIGKQGFGKDSSIGMGKFEIEDYFECHVKNNEFSQYYTLSPFVYGSEDKFNSIYYEPFTRYGKHGDNAVFSGNPFKNPILTIDEGAIVKTNDLLKRNYIGRALTNVSKQFDGNVIHQGYSIVIPCKGDCIKC